MKTLKFEYKNYKGSSKIREVQPKGITFGLTPHITEPEWLLQATDLEKNEEQFFVLKNIQRMVNEEVQRFFCVTVYIMDDQNQFLMLHNRKLNRWVAPGGKVDREETPDEAAVRECLEETGIYVDLEGEKTPVDGGLISPYGIQLNPIIPNVRDHIDLVYFARPRANQKLNRCERETSDIGWFTFEEIKKLKIIPRTLEIASEALKQ